MFGAKKSVSSRRQASCPARKWLKVSEKPWSSAKTGAPSLCGRSNVCGRSFLAFVELGHKGDGAAFLGGDLLGSVLVDRVPVRGTQSAVEPKLISCCPKLHSPLASSTASPAPAMELRMAPQRLDARRPKQRVVDVVVVGGFEVTISLAPGLVGVHEDYELEFGPYEGFQAAFGEPPSWRLRTCLGEATTGEPSSQTRSQVTSAVPPARERISRYPCPA